jgi:uncharacterized protein (DUF2235 family)
MAKAICIFSDGTGQAGGANPTDWTSVYRLYVNTRDVDPAGQICFYDPGVGSDPDQREEWTLLSALNQLAARALGIGLPRNIVDGYMALLLTYEPGDRVFLFGFSRGAYTVRSLGGVLGLCGVPPGLPKVSRWQDIRPRLNDPAIRPIAERAVREVYMTYDDEELRRRRAADFRRDHHSEELAPFFIGVWDTVRALGWQVANIARFGRHRFHNARLNAKVDHGRHALSLDDNRIQFAPELWEERGAPPGQIKQIWFAGDHSDIGGGYGLKMGLTDLAMRWMAEEAMAARDREAHADNPAHFHGLKLDPGLFAELNLDPLAPQHDPRGSLLGRLWAYGSRRPYAEAPQLAGPALTTASVPPRFAAQAVPIDGRMEPYRPDALSTHPDYGAYYVARPAPPGPEGGGA